MKKQSGIVIFALLFSGISLIPATTASAEVYGHYGRVAVVATSGGDYTNPLDAMRALDDWCPDPSATNGCLLKIMPGNYNIGENTLYMEQYVDIEGSGEKRTIITSTQSANEFDSSAATLVGDDNCELRDITIENRGAAYGIAIHNTNHSPSITNVTLITKNGGGDGCGMYNKGASPKLVNVVIVGKSTNNWGIRNGSSHPTMNNVSIYASTGIANSGVINTSSSPTMIRMNIDISGGNSSNYGIYNMNYSKPLIVNSMVSAAGMGGRAINNITHAYPTIQHSFISSTSGLGTITNDADSDAKVANTMIKGPVSGGDATYTCVGTYDDSFDSLNTFCK